MVLRWIGGEERKVKNVVQQIDVFLGKGRGRKGDTNVYLIFT